MKTIIGLDIGGTKTAVLEGAYDACILQRREIATQAQDEFDVTFRRICSEIDVVMQAGMQAGHHPAAISVSIGGPLKIQEGIIQSPPHLPKWVDIPLKELLAQKYQLPVHVEHDGNAGALAEFYFGAGRGAQNIIFVTAGTGLGGGIILNGRIYRGTTDTAGEVGHIRLADDGPSEYGKAGSWEAFCSGAGMVKLAHAMFPLRWTETATTRELVTLAINGDDQARQVIHTSGVWLGRGLAILVDTLNPEVIILGSLGGALGDIFLEPAREVVKAECLAQPVAACRIVPAMLGSRLGDVAALMAAISAEASKMNEILSKSTSDLFASALADSLRVQAGLTKIQADIQETARVITQSLQQGHKVIVFGNGGSAAQAQHLAGELVGKYGPMRVSLPSIALTADSGVLTCIGNDFGYDQVFSRQVEAFAQPGDVVIGITTSGKSPNVIHALATARSRGAITMALTGERGLVDASADYIVAAPSSNTARIQEAHAFIVHCWCDVVDEVFSPLETK